jgi:hypothetical protein
MKDKKETLDGTPHIVMSMKERLRIHREMKDMEKRIKEEIAKAEVTKNK